MIYFFEIGTLYILKLFFKKNLFEKQKEMDGERNSEKASLSWLTYQASTAATPEMWQKWGAGKAAQVSQVDCKRTTIPIITLSLRVWTGARSQKCESDPGTKIQNMAASKHKNRFLICLHCKCLFYVMLKKLISKIEPFSKFTASYSL